MTKTPAIEPWDGAPIPKERFGKDHFSTLAYIETRAVDYKGRLDGDHMRNNARRHRRKLGRYQVNVSLGVTWKPEYATLLKGDTRPEGHDDWDVITDFLACGWLALIAEKTVEEDKVFGGNEVRVKLSEEGWRIVHQLRRWKASGGVFYTFAPTTP